MSKFKIQFTHHAFIDDQYWQQQEKNAKTNQLIESIEREGALEGIGKPEKLKEV